MYYKILREYGLFWLFYRLLYSLKLKVLKIMPILDFIYEKKVKVKNIDIYEFNRKQIENSFNIITETEKNNIVYSADNAIRGTIKGFSSVSLDYGLPINWQLNPLTNKSTSNEKKWYKIPDFDNNRGDIKVIWEISRFTHFFLYLKAYIISKDKKYYSAFSNQLQDWLDNNQYSYGANYKCGQEATLRLINILIVYSGFKEYGLTSKNDDENVLKMLKFSYKKVLSNYNYAYRSVKNNHTISETIGLLIGAWSESNPRRLKKAINKLNKVIDYQFSDDGGYIQDSFNYQRFALQILGFIQSEFVKINPKISDKNINKINNSIYLLNSVQDDYSGVLPNYGANDGALIFPLTQYDYRDYRPTLNSLKYIFNSETIYKDNKFTEELVWFSTYQKSRRNQNRNFKFQNFNDAGIALYSRDNYKLMIINKDISTRPSHFDQLHIDLFSNGHNIFRDSGSYSYVTDLGSQLKKTEYHNTVQVDNLQQMNHKPPFLVYNWTSRKIHSVKENEFIGEYTSKNGYTHSRTIEFKENCLTVTDKINGDGRIANSYLTTCIKPIIQKQVIILNLENEKTVELKTMSNVEIREIEISDYYLEKKQAYRIEMSNEFINKESTITYSIKFQGAE